MASAQQTYDAFVKLGLRPPLRELGFRGSRTTFVWPCSTAFAQVGLQKNRWSTAEKVSFTVNLSVVTHEAWADARQRYAWLSEKPSPNASYPVDGWYERIGTLMPRQNDYWWQLRAEQDWHPLATDVVDAIRDHALPELVRRTTAT